MPCTITSGIGLTCADLKRKPGLNKRVWAFNMDDLRTQIDVSQSFLTTFNLITYASLYKFEGAKYTHSAEAKLIRTEEGNVNWEQTVNLKVHNTNYTEDLVLESLALAETGWIVQTNNDDFLVYGAGAGLTCMEQTIPTGMKIGDSTATTMVFKGNETTLPKRLILNPGTSGNSVQQTLFYLNSITSSSISS